MARNQPAWMNWSQYLGLRLAACGLHMFSPRRNLRSAAALGALIYRLDGRHRRRAIQNIADCFPHLDQRRVEQLARGSMRHFLQLGVEVLFTTRRITLDSWADHIDYDGLASALDVMLRGRPTILITGHYGNWEVLGYLMALMGFNLSAVARPIDNPLVNDWLLGVRQAKGLKIITKWGASEEMMRVMRSGGTVAFIADQNAGEKGMYVPFFGRLASTYKSIGLLALRYNATVVCGFARRIGDQFRFEVGATDVIRPEHYRAQPDPLYYLTARYTRAIEAMIAQSPEQYLWLHRRWKSRPRHEREGRPMPDALRRQLQSLPWMTGPLMDRLSRTAPVSDLHKPGSDVAESASP
jgi:KDO2-lipid IV(A) lauroyltransferase